MKTESQKIHISDADTEFAFDGNLIIVLVNLTNKNANIQVGIVGFDNREFEMKLGERITFIDANFVAYEIRLLQATIVYSNFLVTKLKKKEVLEDSSKLQLEFDINTSMDANEQFDNTEKDRISNRIDLLEKRLQEDFSKSEETSEFIRAQLSYLITCIERMNKNDWIHTSIWCIYNNRSFFRYFSCKQ